MTENEWAQQGPTNEWAQQGPNESLRGPNRAQQMNGPNRAQQMNGPNRAEQMNGPRARAQQGPTEWANRKCKNCIGGFYGNYYIIFSETRFSANPCKTN